MRECRRCKENKEDHHYYLTRTKVLSTVCKICHHEYGKEWRQQNPEKAKAVNKKSREKNRESGLLATRIWRQNNLQYDAHRAKLYRMRKQKQLASWADIEKIKDIYLSCPPGYHVDHIIPLKGKLVSGLHVETNLQHLPAIENMRKRNKYEELV